MKKKKLLKLYVKSNKCRRVLMAASKLDAAIECIAKWKKEGKVLSRSVRVSEVGFELEHPHHACDEIYAVRFIVNANKKEK